MAILGSIINSAVEIKKSIPSVRIKRNAIKQQRATLLKLLKKAKNTRFGETYHFDEILNSADPIQAFRKNIPKFDYNKIHDEWWHRCLIGEEDVCWPGQVKYFALSSGTSEAASKHIPVTSAMLRSIKRTSLRQTLAITDFDFPVGVLEKDVLMIGGSTKLRKKGGHKEGDLSGITTGNIPFWFQPFYKPGKKISAERDWNKKIEMIVAAAKDWDIAVVAGVPAWIQIVIEKIIDRYQVKSIHDIWPNLTIYAHGGVSFEPYRKGFEKLFAKPMIFVDTYLASEGFLAYQSRPNTRAMKLVLNNGIFFEFVPFNEENFTEDGQLLDNAETLVLNEIEEGKEYALLISTNAGTWRYLIGDTIKLTSKADSEIIITGRTKQFLSLCGEHLSVDNMNTALNRASAEFKVSIPEYTVGGVRHENLFAHHWYLGTNDDFDISHFRKRLDEILSEINDDYAVERQAALKEVLITKLPLAAVHDWMEYKGKIGGQHKFPRVFKGAMLQEWQAFASKYN